MPVWLDSRETFRIVPGLTRTRRGSCRTTDHGFFSYCDRSTPEKDVDRALARVGDGVTEFMFHPGLFDEEDVTSIVNLINLEILTSKEAKKEIRKNGIKLANFKTVFPHVPRSEQYSRRQHRPFLPETIAERNPEFSS